MNLPEKFVWRLYSAAVGTITTVIAQKAVSKAWQLATGEQPPDPHDPEVPTGEAIAWVLATGIGVGVSQLLMSRYLGRRQEVQPGL
ncbi:MAG: DUF4235 domain-containing protein [Propionibacteriaceae bacterium]|nr:DUF4235 domain-containing protein [Propionibacteriaceae bacterium]